MWYWVLKVILEILGKVFFKLKVEGLENIPKKTNFIIVANHVSFLDPLVMIPSIPQKIYCIALRDLYKIKWMSWFLYMTETLPSGSSSNKALSLLKKGRNIGLFPEGGVSRDGRLKEFRRGAALLAFKTGKPVLPCAIFGTFQSLPFGKRLPRIIPLKVRIGRPIYLLKEFEEQIDDIRLQEGIFQIRNSVKEMLNAG